MSDRRHGGGAIRERDERPPGPEHPALRERRRQVVREQGRRRRARVLWLTVALAAAAVLWWGLTGPLLTVGGVSVRGYDRPDRDEVVAALTAAGKTGGMMSPPRTAMAEAAGRFPWVESIAVSRDWPRSLTVQVVQARPVALARGADGGTVVVASTGRILEEVDAAPSLGWLTLAGDAPAPGDALSPAEAGLLPFLAGLDADLAARVRDLALADGGMATARLESGPELRLGRPVRLKAKGTALALVLSALSEDDRARATYVDLSVPEHPAVGGLGAGDTLVDTDGDGVPDTAHSTLYGDAAPGAADAGESSGEDAYE